MNGQKYLEEAQNLRENGEFEEALKKLTDAFVSFRKDSNLNGLTETLSAKALTLRHIGERDGDSNMLVLAKHYAMAGIEIAKKNNINPSAPLYNLAKVYESQGQINDALNVLKEALSSVDNESVKAEMRSRVASLEYKNGDEEALQRFEQAISELKFHPHPDEYTQKVWASGLLIDMAERLIGKNNNKAKDFINEARGIIESDDRLKLRREQLEKIGPKLS